jgi:hypothetical protein
MRRALKLGLRRYTVEAPKPGIRIQEERTYNPGMKRLRHNWFIIGKYNPVIKGLRHLSKQNKVEGPKPAE